MKNKIKKKFKLFQNLSKFYKNHYKIFKNFLIFLILNKNLICNSMLVMQQNFNLLNALVMTNFVGISSKSFNG